MAHTSLIFSGDIQEIIDKAQAALGAVIAGDLPDAQRKIEQVKNDADYVAAEIETHIENNKPTGKATV